MPRALARKTTNNIDTALNVEVLEEKATSLGRAGKRVEESLAALRNGPEADRENARRAAAAAVYAYLVQRELCGSRDQEAVIRSYNAPAEVVAILGAT